MFRLRKLSFALLSLFVLHGLILFAGFIAPYSFDTQNRELVFAPPDRIHFWNPRHPWTFRPFIYGRALRPGAFNKYEENRGVIIPIHFFVLGAPYKLFDGIVSRRHLFGVDRTASVSLLGTDSYGRDEFSRLLYGGRVSLFAGLVACLISIALALVLGGLAGYYGRWLDDLIMRTSEVFLTIPWLYLLLAVRASLPLHMDAGRTFFLLISILGVVGWARPARLIRGVVLSARNREYVTAAKGFGASDFYILRRHVLPQASSVVLTQASLYIPQYILAEVTLSFFGLGVSQPFPSWGNMLTALQSYFVLQFCPWMFAPAIALVAVFFTYNRLAAMSRKETGV